MASMRSDNTIAMRPRVRVWCARTGEFLYEPSHPRLDEIRLYVLKKWTWNGGVDIPEAHTLFYLHFVVAQQPVDRVVSQRESHRVKTIRTRIPPSVAVCGVMMSPDDCERVGSLIRYRFVRLEIVAVRPAGTTLSSVSLTLDDVRCH